MTIPYRAEMRTPGQMADDDPFGGRGIRVQFGIELTHEQAADEVTKRYGDVPFISWSTHAWVDGGARPGQAPEGMEKGSS